MPKLQTSFSLQPLSCCCIQVRAVLQGRREDEVEFPFRVSEQELDIIENVPRPPASMLLLGRSGTGKTTVRVNLKRDSAVKLHETEHLTIAWISGHLLWFDHKLQTSW